MHRVVPILVFTALVGGTATAGEVGFESMSISDIRLPELAEVQRPVPSTPLGLLTSSEEIQIIGIQSTETESVATWAASSQTALDDLEARIFDRFVPPASDSDPSDRLTTSPFANGQHPFGNSKTESFTDFTKTTVVPLPSAGLLGLAGLAIVGATGPLSRRR